MENQENLKISVKGIIFEAPAKYQEGDTLSKNEAKALNQMRMENLRNNFASKVEKAQEEAGGEAIPDDVLSTLHSEFADYAAKYEFSGQRQLRAPVDPIQRTARSLAKDAIKTAIQSQGGKVSDLADGQMDAMVDALLAQAENPVTVSIMEEAKRRASAMKGVADAGLADIIKAAAIKAA